MNYSLRTLIAIFFFIHFQFIAHATHIVGGEMNYTCLGNNEFEISLTIFRDCENGSPYAWFDDPAKIGIYDIDGVLVDSLFIELIGNDTLDQTLSNECFVAPIEVCVHTTTYNSIVELPPRIGGYELIYQRCCRNTTIVNIVEPLSAGATYSARITEEALLECNSSAQFLSWPPIYICAGEPIYFDQSATDIDGDSIAYSLCTPLLGATPDVPEPLPWEQTVPEPLVWLDPPYNLTNVLGGIPLEIDPITGLLTGTPNTLGQFVVGICLEEYRNGELISTTRRDFQYNVGECNAVYAAFFAPEFQCDELQVNFENNSEFADAFEWYFNDPGNPDAISFEMNPSYVFSDTGTYQVMLVAQPGICADTFIQEINIQYSNLFINYDLEEGLCTDSILLEVSNFSSDENGEPQSVEWVLSDGQSADTDEASFYIDESGMYTLTLNIIAANGCPESVDTTFEVNLIDIFLPNDSLFICHGDSVALNPFGSNDYQYNWFPSDGLNNFNLANPLASPNEPTAYTVDILDLTTSCEITRTVFVDLPEKITLDIGPDIVTCDPKVLLVANSDLATSYAWSENSDFDPILSFGDSALVVPFGSTTYYAFVRDSFNCLAYDTINIVGNGINIEKDSMPIICEGETVTIGISSIDPIDQLIYSWSPEDQIFGSNTGNMVEVLPPSPGIHYYYVDLQNQFDCTLLDSIPVAVLDTTSQVGFQSFNQCAGYTVNFENTSINADFYSWNFGDPENPSASSSEANPSYTYAGPGTYDVSLTINAAVNCPESITLPISVMEPEIIIDFDWEYELCGDSVVLELNNLSTNNQSNFTNQIWTINDDMSISEPSPTFTFYESQELIVALEMFTDDGCMDLHMDTIPIIILEETLDDSIFICSGESTFLNPENNPDYEYTWSPSNGLNYTNVANPEASPMTSTLYTVEVKTNDPPCQIERQIYVEVSTPINFEMSMDEVTCEESVVIFASGQDGLSYTWADGPDFQNVISEEPELEVFPDRPSIYYLQVEDEFGCTDGGDVSLTSNMVKIEVDNFMVICAGDSLELELVNLQAADDLSIVWEPAEAILLGQGSANPIVAPLENTVFSVTAQNQFDCIAMDDVEVDIFDFVPPLSIDAMPDTIIAGETVQLTATNDEGYTYFWKEDVSLSATNIFNPTASPTVTTLYELEITNQDGCSNRGEVLVTVIDPTCEHPHIFMPNAFTPNGDDKNNVLELKGQYVEEMQLVIYDRWGEKVFESFSQSNGWDGTYKGVALPPDVFAYYLKVRCINGNEFQKQGNVTILK